MRNNLRSDFEIIVLAIRLFSDHRNFRFPAFFTMNSIGENCNDLKSQYDSCFLSWFSDKFLKGETNDEICAPYFKVYQQCVKKAIKENHIELKDVGKEVIGSTEENKVPPPKS